jgi:hypothetical protein
MQPSDQTTKLVARVSEAFFDQLVKEDFNAERAFMSDRLANMASATSWRQVRQKVIETAGKTPRYSAHGLTYYQGEHLLAAVDFSARAEVPGNLICGYMVWELTASNVAGLVRFEQNVVSVDVFRSMPVHEAAQTMVNWRCSAKVIEDVLTVTLN